MGWHPGAQKSDNATQISPTQLFPDKADVRGKLDMVDTLGKFLTGDQSNKVGCVGHAVSLVCSARGGSLVDPKLNHLRITISPGALNHDEVLSRTTTAPTPRC